jgi:hypothetical protein
VADRFALGNGPARQVQGARFAVDGTGGAAVRAEGLFAENLGLLFEQGGEGAFGDAGRRGAGELLHGLEVGIQAGAAVAEGPAGDDFAPAGGEVTDFLEEFGGKFTTRHGWYRLVLAAKVPEECLRPLYDPRLGLAKLWMASRSGRASFSV